MRILSVFLFFCLFSVNAWGQVSRALIQETVGERVELAMREGDKVLGVVRTVSDSSIIMRDEEGRLRELRISDIREVKLLEAPAAAPSATTRTSPAATPSTAVSSGASAQPVSPATTREERIARYQQQQQASYQASASTARQSLYDSEPRAARSAVSPDNRGQYNFEKGTRLRNGGIALATIGTIAGSIGFGMRADKIGKCLDESEYLSEMLDCTDKGNAGLIVGSLGFLSASAGLPMAIAGGVRRGMGTRQLNDQIYGGRERRMSFAPSISPRNVGARFNLEF